MYSKIKICTQTNFVIKKSVILNFINSKLEVDKSQIIQINGACEIKINLIPHVHATDTRDNIKESLST